MGLIGYSLIGSSFLCDMPNAYAKDKEMSLYEEYILSNKQKADEYNITEKEASKAPEIENYRNTVRENKRAAEIAEDENLGDPNDFVSRIKNIITEYRGEEPTNFNLDYSITINGTGNKNDVVTIPLDDQGNIVGEPTVENKKYYNKKTVTTTQNQQTAINKTQIIDEKASIASKKMSVPTLKIEPKPNIDTTEGRYNFDWRGTPLVQSIYAVAKIANKGVVINGSLDGKVYLSLNQVTCNTTLDYLSRAYNFNWMMENDNIIITVPELMLQSEVFDVSYVDKNKLREEFKAIGIDENRIYGNSQTNTISVTGTPYQLQEARKRIKRLDHPVAQCLLLAQLIEISHGKSLDLGLQYTMPSYSHTADETGSGDVFHGRWLPKLSFSASASANRELSKGNVVARPMVMTLNGESGYVQFGDSVPIMTTTATSASTSVTVEYKDVGTNLKMTPIINEKLGEVQLNIEAEVSNIVSWTTTGQTRAPQIATRKTTTSAHLKSGQSFTIGGLMSVNELDNLSGIPGLMDLPILGKLFSYHSKSKTYSEVYIMITPFIVTEDIDPAALLKKAGGKS